MSAFLPEEAELAGGDIIAAVDPARPRVTPNDAWPTALLATLDLAEESKDALATRGCRTSPCFGTRGETGMAVAVLNAIGGLAA